MAIALDSNSGYFDSGGAASSLTKAFTNTAGNFLVVTVSNFTNQITSITYNGVGLTKAVESASDASVGRVSIWYLANPATGTNNIVITAPNASFTIQAGALSYSGVKNAAPEATTSGTATSGTSQTVSLTTITNNDWMFLADQTFGANTAGTGATLRYNNASAGHAGFDSGAAITPAGSYSMTVNANSGHWAWAAMTIQPAAAAATTKTLAALGVG